LGDRALAHGQRGGDGGLGELLTLATLSKTGGKRRVCQVRSPGNITAFDDITYYKSDDSANSRSLLAVVTKVVAPTLPVVNFPAQELECLEHVLFRDLTLPRAVGLAPPERLGVSSGYELSACDIKRRIDVFVP
jgi:hypothetical protein